MVVSANMVRAVPAANNAAPVFPDEDEATGTQVVRKVDENSPPGTRVGEPVVTNDALGDVLTYTLTDSSNSFDINPATGQITVGARTTLDFETTPSYTVMVTSTDPAGPGYADWRTTQDVTITINDVNEAPMISGGHEGICSREHPYRYKSWRHLCGGGSRG